MPPPAAASQEPSARSGRPVGLAARLAVRLVLGVLLAGCADSTPAAAPADSPVDTWVSGSPTSEPAVEEPALRDPPTVDPSASEPGARGKTRAGKPQGQRGPTDLGDVAELSDLAELVEQQAKAQRRAGPVLGADMSWPQCPRGLGIPERLTLGAPLPLAEARYVVVGLTNGPAFYENPCLADQVSLVRDAGRLLAAYTVTSFPDAATLARVGRRGPHDASTREGALRNVGYQQARFGVASMRRTGLVTPVVWVDVEPVPGFEWSSDPAANAAVVGGVVRGYRDAGYTVGVYSTAYLWQQIVGDLRLGLPEWRAAGQTARAEALRRCGPEAAIQGGPAILSQWVEERRDQNVTCPGVSADLGRWFSGIVG